MFAHYRWMCGRLTGATATVLALCLLCSSSRAEDDGGFSLESLGAIEEPELGKRLGEEYVNYRARTPMFIPGLGSRSKPA